MLYIFLDNLDPEYPKYSSGILFLEFYCLTKRVTKTSFNATEVYYNGNTVGPGRFSMHGLYKS